MTTYVSMLLVEFDGTGLHKFYIALQQTVHCSRLPQFTQPEEKEQRK